MTPHSPGTGQINTLIWIGFIAAAIVVVAINLGLFGAIRRFRGGRGRAAQPTRGTRGLQFRVAGGLTGFAIVLFVLGIIFTSNATQTPSTTSAGLTSYKGKPFPGPLVIHATGQQWMWRYNYPNGSFSYYKLVIPAHTAIDLELESTDVIHTWSVPDLAPKTDAVPGKVSHIFFRADAEGEFYGQSATLSGQALRADADDRRSGQPRTVRRIHRRTAEGHQAGQEAAEKIDNQKTEELAKEEEVRTKNGSRIRRRRNRRRPEEESEGRSLARRKKNRRKSLKKPKAAKKRPKAAPPTRRPAKKSSPKTARSATAPTGHGGNGGPDLRTMPLAKNRPAPKSR